MTQFDLNDELYAHLRRLAARVGSSGGAGTLNPTSLVHEAWEKLAEGDVQVVDRTHFIALSARTMRQILVDRLRSQGRQKRGGNDRRTTLAGVPGLPMATDLLDLDQALHRLAALDAQAADVVVLRSFGGLTVAEVAEEQSCSERTVANRWKFGRAFLLTELS